MSRSTYSSFSVSNMFMKPRLMLDSRMRIDKGGSPAPSLSFKNQSSFLMTSGSMKIEFLAPVSVSASDESIRG